MEGVFALNNAFDIYACSNDYYYFTPDNEENTLTKAAFRCSTCSFSGNID